MNHIKFSSILFSSETSSPIKLNSWLCSVSYKTKGNFFCWESNFCNSLMRSFIVFIATLFILLSWVYNVWNEGFSVYFGKYLQRYWCDVGKPANRNGTFWLITRENAPQGLLKVKRKIRLRILPVSYDGISQLFQDFFSVFTASWYVGGIFSESQLLKLWPFSVSLK